MSNSFYNHSTFPTPNAPGSSANMRAELDLITAGFNKLPTLSGNGYKVAMINSAGTALVASSALQQLALTQSTIDSTPIGATTRAAGNFTTLSANSTVNLGSAVTIAGGVIDNTVIGGTTPAAAAFTTASAASGFTGNLTGNVTGNLTGNVTGNVTGDVAGNVTTSTGTSTFNNVTITGTLDMSAGTVGTITGLATPTNSSDAAPKSYVDTQDALRLALSGGTMSGAIAMGANRITGLGDPSANQDAATKAYVDSVAQGLDVKASVRAATTANITLSGTQTIDGVAVVANDRVLVKNQTTTSANGIYVASAGSWTRSNDADTWNELVSAFVFVEEGTTNADTGWTCTVNAGGTLGTTAVTFAQFSGAGSITVGNGLTRSGNTLSVLTVNSARITVGGSGIDLATTGVTASTYRSVTVDVYGRVTAGTNPTTISAYGITDAYTKTEIDTTVGTLLSRSGGTMSGQINMGSQRIVSMADPSSAQDAATKAYVDSILGSATSAATSASAAATSATNASNSATAAAGSATSAATSATNAASSLATFQGQYLGAQASNPTLDLNGNALTAGDLYFNTTAGEMRVYNGTAWVQAYLPGAAYVLKSGDTITGNLTLNAGTANGVAYLNGSRVLTTGSALTFDGTNFATTGTASAAKLIATGGTAAGNGMYLPAANTLALTTAGVDRVRVDSAGNTLIGTTTNSNSSLLTVAGTISETANTRQWLVASQYDVGNNPNQIPLNQYLGALAFLQRPYRKVQRQLATAGQTAFTITGGYALGFIDVYINGVKQYSNDFTETNTNTITLTAGAALNDEVEFVVWWVEA